MTYDEMEKKVKHNFVVHFYRNKFMHYGEHVVNFGVHTCLHTKDNCNPWWYAYVFDCVSCSVFYSGAVVPFEDCPSRYQADELIDTIIAKMCHV